MRVNFVVKGFLLAASLIFSSISQAAVTVVPGTSDLWLAGMPAGSTASLTDSAPAQSPVLISVTPGSWLSFSVSINVAAGLVGNCSGCTSATPDGGGLTTHSVGAENGISDVNAPVNSLMGVFIGSSQPSLTAAPATLDFGTIGTSFTSLSPQLKQVFFIGDGLGAGSVVQQFQVPTAATSLYLGTMDGYQWANNVGAYNVSVSAVPEPGEWALLASGLGLLGFMARRKKNT